LEESFAKFIFGGLIQLFKCETSHVLSLPLPAAERFLQDSVLFCGKLTPGAVDLCCVAVLFNLSKV